MTNLFSQKPNRQYLSLKFNPLNKKNVEEVLNKLLLQPPIDFNSAKVWFGLFHEFSCSISEAQTILELNLNLEKSKNHEKNCEEFEINILSLLLNSREKMMSIYLNSPFKYSMHAYDKGYIENSLFSKMKYSTPLLSSLQIEENKLIREYKNWTYFASTSFQGKAVSLSSLVGKMSDLNEIVRKEAFVSYWGFIKKNEEKYQELFDKLLINRRAQASVSHCKFYTELAFSELGRLDYGTNECSILRKSILKKVVPLITELSEKQGLDFTKNNIEPWNSQIWPKLIPKKAPANGVLSNLTCCLQKVMADINPMFGELFNQMEKEDLLNVFPKSGKSPGAFTVTFQESGTPFLFGNFGTNTRDVFTFIHEFGHCLHGYATAPIKNILLRQPGFEFCEVSSLGLELLSGPYLHHLWQNPKDAQNAFKNQLFHMLQFWPFMAMMDEWQHAVYSSESFVNGKERNAIWLDLSKKYRPHVNWGEIPQWENLGWLSRHHIFTSPFYFIDYGIAQIGALQLWKQSLTHYSKAVNNYIRALSLGGQINLPSLFNELGVEFSFEEDLIESLAQTVRQALFTE